MKTIEERAKEYSYKILYRDTIHDNLLRGRELTIYSDAAKEQKKLTLEAFDKWLCENSWITRDENNRKTLAELRSLIEHI